MNLFPTPGVRGIFLEKSFLSQGPSYPMSKPLVKSETKFVTRGSEYCDAINNSSYHSMLIGVTICSVSKLLYLLDLLKCPIKNESKQC